MVFFPLQSGHGLASSASALSSSDNTSSSVASVASVGSPSSAFKISHSVPFAGLPTASTRSGSISSRLNSTFRGPTEPRESSHRRQFWFPYRCLISQPNQARGGLHFQQLRRDPQCRLCDSAQSVVTLM